MPLVPLVQGIGLRGMPFDTQARDVLVREVSHKLAILDAALAMEGITQPGSSQKLSKELTAKGLPLSRLTPGGTQFQTDLDALASIDHHFNNATAKPKFPWLKGLIEWKKLEKVRANAESLIPCEDGYIRTSLRTDTKTARYRSAGFREQKKAGWCPHCRKFGWCGANLQNLAKDDPLLGVRIKSLFVPRPGWVLWELDMKLFEIIVMAWRANCRLLLERMLDASLDLHTIHARILFPEGEITKNRRTLAKNFFYAWRGGGGKEAIQRALAKKGEFLDQATIFQHMMRMNAEYPEVMAWNIMVEQELIKQEATKGEYRLVRNAFGRPRVLMNFKPLKEALATEISGTAADILNFALLRIARETPWVLPHICMQIHDSFVGHSPKEEAPKVIAAVKAQLEHPVWLPKGWGETFTVFPADAKITETSWSDMEDYKEAA